MMKIRDRVNYNFEILSLLHKLKSFFCTLMVAHFERFTAGN